MGRGEERLFSTQYVYEPRGRVVDRIMLLTLTQVWEEPGSFLRRGASGTASLVVMR